MAIVCCVVGWYGVGWVLLVVGGDVEGCYVFGGVLESAVRVSVTLSRISGVVRHPNLLLKAPSSSRVMCCWVFSHGNELHSTTATAAKQPHSIAGISIQSNSAGANTLLFADLKCNMVPQTHAVRTTKLFLAASVSTLCLNNSLGRMP